MSAIIPYPNPGSVLYYSDTMIFFDCPGCDSLHGITKGRWRWNDDMVRPTFQPSIKVTWDFGVEGRKPKCCHSFVTDGKIRFLNDCTHKLAGQTVQLPCVHKDSDL